MRHEALASWREKKEEGRRLPKALSREEGRARPVRADGNPLSSRKAVGSGAVGPLIPMSPQNFGLFFLGNRYVVRSAYHYAEIWSDVKRDVPACRQGRGRQC